MKESVEEIVASVLSGTELELIDVVYQTGGKRPIIRIFIDKVNGGVTVDECAKINRELNVRFFVEESIPETAIVEVSSPGIDRPLKTRRDYERNLNRKIDVYYIAADGRSMSATGTFTGLGESDITLTTAKGALVLPLSSVVNARPKIEF